MTSIHLGRYVAGLSITTSLVIIAGVVVTPPKPAPVVTRQAPKPEYRYMTVDEVLATWEEAFDTPAAPGWEERLAAWEKTPEGQKALKEWREGR